MSAQPFRYLDNNATTRVAPEVVEAMLPFLEGMWANPSSGYASSREVAKHLAAARLQVGALLNAEPGELVFTSCATESINAALHSATEIAPEKRHIVTTTVEHPACLNYCRALEKRGYETTYVPVDSDGQLDIGLLERCIRSDTAVVSVMWANNETGVVFPVAEVGAICQSKNVLFHTDAVQVAGKLPIDVRSAKPDFLSLSAHKFHAPKGIGVLYVRKGVGCVPYLVGGHQEGGRRGGTENVAGIVAVGRAAELAIERLSEVQTRVRGLRDRLEETLLAAVPDSHRNGAREPRLPNTSNLAFDGLEAEALLMMLDQAGMCASSGSACTTGSPEPSRVLMSMGLGRERARGSVRFSLGYYNTDEDVDCLVGQLPRMAARLRGMV